MKYVIILILGLSLLPAAQAMDATILIGDSRFDVEIATTPDERAHGLMDRDALPAGQGMLFVYQEPHPVSFWMKNTRIPLDILYFDSEGRLFRVYPESQPCRSSPCPLFPSELPVQYVLEINGGETETQGIRIGDRFHILGE